MKLAALLSGGKDSVFSMYVSQQWGWTISHAVVMQPRRLSWMFHTDNIHLAATIADAMNVPTVIQPTSAEPENELEDLKEVLASLDIEGVISGAVASEYQRTRIERVCHALKINSFTPLWHKDPQQLLHDMIAADFSIVVVAVAAEGLGEKWLGRILDMDALIELKHLQKHHGVHELGEGGEYETLVLDCPLFMKRLFITKAKSEWDGSRGTLCIERLGATSK